MDVHSPKSCTVDFDVSQYLREKSMKQLFKTCPTLSIGGWETPSSSLELGVSLSGFVSKIWYPYIHWLISAPT